LSFKTRAFVSSRHISLDLQLKLVAKRFGPFCWVTWKHMLRHLTVALIGIFCRCHLTHPVLHLSSSATPRFLVLCALQWMRRWWPTNGAVMCHCAAQRIREFTLIISGLCLPKLLNSCYRAICWLSVLVLSILHQHTGRLRLRLALTGWRGAKRYALLSRPRLRRS